MTAQNDSERFTFHLLNYFLLRNKTLTESTLRSHHAPVILINPFNVIKASQRPRARVDEETFTDIRGAFYLDINLG